MFCSILRQSHDVAQADLEHDIPLLPLPKMVGLQAATLCLVQLPRTGRVTLCNTVSGCLLGFLFCFVHF